MQNSLFVPDLGRYVNRTPTYTLTRSQTEGSSTESVTSEEEPESPQERTPLDKDHETTAQLRTLNTLSSVLSEHETQFAVLPDNSSLDGWSPEDIRELNDHVRHMLHSRRSKFKRSMRGFGKYISKRRSCLNPACFYKHANLIFYIALGFFVFIYATLITLFGLAWVLFLIGMYLFEFYLRSWTITNEGFI